MQPSKRAMLAMAAAGATVASAASATSRAGWRRGVDFETWAAINAATQGYADCLDRFDLEGLVALFAPDCVYDYAPGRVMRGRDAVAAGARLSLAGVNRSSHFVGPPVVTPRAPPGQFNSTVYFMAFHEQKDGGAHTVHGRCLDVFAPDAHGALLIAHRKTIGHAAEGTTSPRYWLERASS